MARPLRLGARRLQLTSLTAALSATVLVGTVVAAKTVGSDDLTPVRTSAQSGSSTSSPGPIAHDEARTAQAQDPYADQPEPREVVTPPKRPKRPTLAQLDKRMGRQGLTRVESLSAFSFKVASFNVLGASHTRGPKARKGFARAEDRLPHQVALLENYGITVAGLQEFQYPQVHQLRGLRGSRYDIFPGTTMGNHLADNSIIWNTGVWEALDRRTTGIPYFHGRLTPMPHVLLRHRESGRQVWFGNYHNPANVAGNAAGWRNQATRLEAELAVSLGADGTPVIMTGDMNDRAEFICPFSAISGMRSADGGYSTGDSCHTPGNMSVDWIVGSSQVSFSGYAQDWSTKGRKLSDHPLIAATASVPGTTERAGCVRKKARKAVGHYCPPL